MRRKKVRYAHVAEARLINLYMQKDIINLLTIFSLILFTSVGSAFAFDRQQQNLAVLEAQAEALALLPQEVTEVVEMVEPVEVMIATTTSVVSVVEEVAPEPVKAVVLDTSKQDAAAAAERVRLAAVEAERKRQADLAQAEADAAALAEARAQAKADAEAEALAQAQAEAEAAALAKKNSRKSRAS